MKSKDLSQVIALLHALANAGKLRPGQLERLLRWIKRLLRGLATNDRPVIELTIGQIAAEFVQAVEK